MQIAAEPLSAAVRMTKPAKSVLIHAARVKSAAFCKGPAGRPMPVSGTARRGLDFDRRAPLPPAFLHLQGSPAAGPDSYKRQTSLDTFSAFMYNIHKIKKRSRS
jgi:hypothetical protein